MYMPPASSNARTPSATVSSTLTSSWTGTSLHVTGSAMSAGDISLPAVIDCWWLTVVIAVSNDEVLSDDGSDALTSILMSST